jgi:hypothetical protein
MHTKEEWKYSSIILDFGTRYRATVFKLLTTLILNPENKTLRLSVKVTITCHYTMHTKEEWKYSSIILDLGTR